MLDLQHMSNILHCILLLWFGCTIFMLLDVKSLNIYNSVLILLLLP